MSGRVVAADGREHRPRRGMNTWARRRPRELTECVGCGAAVTFTRVKAAGRVRTMTVRDCGTPGCEAQRKREENRRRGERERRGTRRPSRAQTERALPRLAEKGPTEVPARREVACRHEGGVARVERIGEHHARVVFICGHDEWVTAPSALMQPAERVDQRPVCNQCAEPFEAEEGKRRTRCPGCRVCTRCTRKVEWDYHSAAACPRQGQPGAREVGATRPCGHARTAENTTGATERRPGGECRVCKLERMARYHARSREAVTA